MLTVQNYSRATYQASLLMKESEVHKNF